MKLSVLSKSLRISLSIYKGESSSEYERAYSFADMLMPQFLECLNAGIPRSEIVTHLMIGARVKREVATITICKKLKKIGYVPKAIDDDEEDIPDDLDVSAKSAKIKSEVSKEVFLKREQSQVPATAPVTVVPTALVAKAVKSASAKVADPVMPPAPAEISAEPQLPKEPSSPGKWDHLRKQIIVGKGFLGEEDKWMTPEEMLADKERRARIEAVSIASGKLEWKK